MKKLVYLSLGSNVGDRRVNLEAAIRALGGLGAVLRVSSFYETAPVEYLEQPNFFNCAVLLETDKMPRQLLAAIWELERALGRRPSAARGLREASQKGPRPIDIDILLFGRSIVETPELIVPHPALHERRFVLEPLVEIAPDLRHPVLKRTMRELLDALPPSAAWVRKLPA